MRDDDAFTVWSWREHLVSVLRVAIDAVLGQVNHGDELHPDSRVPDAPRLGHLLP